MPKHGVSQFEVEEGNVKEKLVKLAAMSIDMPLQSQINQLLQDAENATQQGGKAMVGMVNSINEIRNEITGTAKVIHRLDAARAACAVWLATSRAALAISSIAVAT